MVKLILSIYTYFSQHRKWLPVLLAALTALLLWAASRIRFQEDISAFLPGDGQTGRIRYAYQHLGPANHLLVSVGAADTASAPEEELLMAAVDQLAERLRQADSAGTRFKKLDYKVDQQQLLAVSRFLVENMPYFLTEADYQRMDLLLTEEYIRAQLNSNKQALLSPLGLVAKQTIVADPLHFSAPLLAGLRRFQAANSFRLYHDFIFSNDRKEALLIIEPHNSASETRENAEMLRLIDDAIQQTQARFEQKVRIRYFGPADIAVTNADRIRQDSLYASALAVVLILSILMYVFRSAANILLTAGSLLFGWLFALGLLAVLKEEVSLIAVGISSIIIGIAVNYPLHFILHHRHRRDTPLVIKEIVAPLTIGNITTVGAFLSLLFISSDAMRDLGLFASLLLVGTIAFVLLFLPHLLKKSAGRPAVEQEHTPAWGKWLSGKPRRNKGFPLLFVALSVVLCLLSFHTTFDANMQNINYMTPEQKGEMQKFISAVEQGEQRIYYVSTGKNLDEALAAHEDVQAKVESLQAAGLLSGVSGPGIYLPSQRSQRQRLERWKTFCETHKELLARIGPIGVESGFTSGAFDRFSRMLQTDYAVQEIDYFEPVTAALARNYIVNHPDGGMVMSLLHTTQTSLDSLEAGLNALDARSFSFDAGSIGRGMIGTLSADFHTVLWMCGLIVFGFLVFTLGRIELSLLAFLPLTVGWFWILGIMNLFDIRFNIVNIILASFIFGQGDDYTIFMTEGLMYEYTYKRKLLASYKNSIVLSAVIMFIGIGSLIFAKHPALRSLAEITMIGMGAVVLMTFTLPPLIFRRLTQRKGAPRLMPVTLANLASSVYAFTVFLIGSVVTTAVGFLFFTLGKSTDPKKLRYHRLMCRIARFVVVRIPRVKTTCNRFDRAVFDKPAVIICNHQSHIDLMCVMSLTPKLVILTNDWVWNSPFYGRLIRYADFYPVSNGAEQALEQLRGVVEKGYSILVFPEGTRSGDCSIQRFHRGAFYLAEQLNLDILPVLLHGVGHLLPKEEFMLRKGEIHIRVLPRTAYHAAGETYAERAKNMRRFYQEEYAKLATEVETADYYADLTLHNYIYKGASVERAVRRQFKRYGNYRELSSQLKNHSRVLVVNCGYGALPLLLSLVHKNMRITATDSDPDKLELAANCTWVGENLRYAGEVGPEESFDAVVLIGPTEAQRAQWDGTGTKLYSLND